MSYSAIHKFFLQTIMHRGVLTEREAKDVISKHSDDYSLSDLLNQINREIRPYKQQIKSVTDESSGTKRIVFMSLADDEAARCQNMFSVYDLEYFKFLLDEIMTSNEKFVSGINAMNVASKVEAVNFSKTRAQELLDQWTARHYLKKEPAGCYSLDVRTIQEFDTLIQHHYTDVLDKCFLCKKIIYQKSTECTSCGESHHKHCLKLYTNKISKWPCCKTDYVQTETNATQIANESSSAVYEDFPMNTATQSQESLIDMTQDDDDVD